MTFEEWERRVPQVMKDDSVWSFYAYRKALYLYELAWDDCDHLMCDPRGVEVTRQLIRSAGSISANIEEGAGRGYGKDRKYFLRVSLGSARETRGWYFRGRRLLSVDVLRHRIDLLSQIIALLVTELKLQRDHSKRKVLRRS